MKKTVIRNIIALVLTVIVFIGLADVSCAQIVIIVNKDNPIDNVSFKELQQIYLGEKLSFSNRKSIVLGVDADIKQQFIKKLFNWSEIKFKQHWMNMIFSGASYVAPKEFKRLDELVRFITLNEGSIAFIDITEVDENIKVVTVDGKLPENEDYPLN